MADPKYENLPGIVSKTAITPKNRYWYPKLSIFGLNLFYLF